MSRPKGISPEEFRRRYGHESRGLGGVVDDGDIRHKLHSLLVRECGTWLNGQPGVLVWATGTGRWTGKATYGTPGVPDLVGWSRHKISIDMNIQLPPWAKCGAIELPLPLYVECKVLPDKLRPAQVEFRKLAEEAGALYYLAEWDGESDDPAAGLREQWEQQGAASG